MLAFAAITALTRFAIAATLTVDTLDDEFLPDGDCSLREAIFAANNNISVDACGSGDWGPDEIVVAASGTINLSAPLIIEESLRIRGSSWSATRISGQNSTRVLEVDMAEDPSDDLTLEDLSIEHGYSETIDGGAGILVSCVDILRLDRIRMTGHTLDDAPGAPGAAISMAPDSGCEARLEVHGSEFSGNRARVGVGGAIYLSNTGGGVGSAQITSSRFSGNIAAGDGGALFGYHVPTLSIEDVLFSGNRIDEEVSPNGRGGAVHLRSQDHEGGTSLTLIERTSFIGNSAGARGGAVSLKGPVVASIRNSTFHGNNVADTGGEALDADSGSTAAVFFTTFHDNGSGPGSIADQSIRGSGFSTERTLATRDDGSITLDHSIVATSWNLSQNCSGTVDSNGFNIDSGQNCTSLVSDRPGTDPDLAPLSADSGTDLHFDLPILIPSAVSPAVDGGWAVCPGPFGTETSVDQRGQARPILGQARGDGVRCDIGAIEFRRSDQPLIFRDRFEAG